MVKAFKYKVDLIVDIVHGYRHKFVEFHIPQYKLYFNLYDGKLNVYSISDNKSRNFIQKVYQEDFTDNFLEKIKHNKKLKDYYDRVMREKEDNPDIPTELIEIDLDEDFVQHIIDIDLLQNKLKDKKNFILDDVNKLIKED